jgi:hypothetical protein
MIANTHQDQYKITLLDSFFGWCSIWSVNTILESLPPERRKSEKLKIIKKWEENVKADFQEQLSSYNTVLSSGKVTNADKLMQVEDFQTEFNRLFTETKQEIEGMLGL